MHVPYVSYVPARLSSLVLGEHMLCRLSICIHHEMNYAANICINTWRPHSHDESWHAIVNTMPQLLTRTQQTSTSNARKSSTRPKHLRHLRHLRHPSFTLHSGLVLLQKLLDDFLVLDTEKVVNAISKPLCRGT